MKVVVTIKHTQTATVDIGGLPVSLVQNLLDKHEGSFDGNYGLGDVASTEKWVVDSVEVEPVEKAKG